MAAEKRDGERALVEERLRIARDLHDLVGHEVAVVNMQLGVAEVSLPPGADRAVTALAAARVAVQSVLNETQQILALLRRGDEEAATSDPAPDQSSWRGCWSRSAASGWTSRPTWNRSPDAC